jgi:hypothetical protein
LLWICGGNEGKQIWTQGVQLGGDENVLSSITAMVTLFSKGPKKSVICTREVGEFCDMYPTPQ